jgi:hypothetical protein
MAVQVESITWQGVEIYPCTDCTTAEAKGTWRFLFGAKALISMNDDDADC